LGFKTKEDTSVLIAKDYLGAVGVGVTSPQFFRADNGNIYIVKLQNNRLGPRVLVSEFIGAKFGEIIGLCFPESDIIEINSQTLQSCPGLLELGVKSGKHFASKYIEDVEYIAEDHLSRVDNIAQMAGVMLFDHIFHNSDRTNNRKNLLLRKEASGYKIYAIDNSHLFRSGRWTLDTLDKLAVMIKVYYHRSYGLLLRDLLSTQDFVPYVEKVERLSDEQICNLISDIPEEWLTEDSECEALVKYIKTRRDIVKQIWENICKQIPRERGGRRSLMGKVYPHRDKRQARFLQKKKG
jgi:hypothetical protein